MRFLWVSALVVLVDQVSKVIVVRTIAHAPSIPLIGDWLKFTYTENPGMAFGVTFGPPALITIFSIVATAIIVVYAVTIRNGYGPYRMSLALVLGGAIGNIIDRVFYGKLLYGAPLFQGKVVDFIHVDLWRGFVSEGVPFLGGKYLALFPIWNVADMAIVVGVAGILIFQKRFHLLAAEQAEAAEGGASAVDGPPVVPTAPPPGTATAAGSAPAEIAPASAVHPSAGSPPVDSA